MGRKPKSNSFEKLFEEAIKQAGKLPPKPFEFYVESDLIIQLNNNEFTVNLGLFGYWQQTEGTSIPNPVQYRVNSVKYKDKEVPISREVMEYIEKFWNTNPMRIKETALQAIQTFGMECLSQRKGEMKFNFKK